MSRRLRKQQGERFPARTIFPDRIGRNKKYWLDTYFRSCVVFQIQGERFLRRKHFPTE